MVAIAKKEKISIDAETRELKGRLLLVNKNYDDAILEFEESYQLKPTYEKLRILSTVNFNLYRFAEADKYLRKTRPAQL